MKHETAIKAMDANTRVRAQGLDGDDEGFIVALGQYDTSNCHDHERRHPLNKRNWALVSWDSGARTWTPLRDLQQ